MTQTLSAVADAFQNNFWIVHGYYFVSVESQIALIVCLVEVRIKSTSTTRLDSVRDAVLEYIEPIQHIALPSTLQDWEDSVILRDNVEHIQFGDSGTFSSQNRMERI